MKKTWFVWCLSLCVSSKVFAYSVSSGHKVHDGGSGGWSQEQPFYRWNITTNPFGFMIGTWAVGASVALNQNIAFHMDTYYIAPYALYKNASGGGVSVGLPVFFEKTFHGFYLEPGARVFAVKNTSGSSDLTQVGTGPVMLMGWQKTWHTGLSLAIAFGGGYTWMRTVDGKDVLQDSKDIKTSGFLPDGYFRVGYAF